MMEIITGILKSLDSKIVFNNVRCEFEFDIHGGIKEGLFPNLLIDIDEHLLLGKHFYFKNNVIVMNIYIHRISNNNVYFQTVRFKRTLDEPNMNKLIVYVTKTELFWYQKLNIEGFELILTFYNNASAIECRCTGEPTSNTIKKIMDIIEDVLLYIQLVQLQYCKSYGFEYGKCLYIDYRNSEFKPFIYRKAKSLNKKDAELFITKFIRFQYKGYLTNIIYRLVSAKTSTILEIKYVWLIFALEAIESVYNMKKGTDIKISGKHIHFNKIVDDILPNNDLKKLYFKNGEFWKPLLWVYRDKYVHFLRDVNDLNEKPDIGQEEKLEYIFKDNYKVLTKEFKKLIPIAQRIVCEIIDFDYEANFFKIY